MEHGHPHWYIKKVGGGAYNWVPESRSLRAGPLPRRFVERHPGEDRVLPRVRPRPDSDLERPDPRRRGFRRGADALPAPEYIQVTDSALSHFILMPQTGTSWFQPTLARRPAVRWAGGLQSCNSAVRPGTPPSDAPDPPWSRCGSARRRSRFEGVQIVYVPSVERDLGKDNADFGLADHRRTV